MNMNEELWPNDINIHGDCEDNTCDSINNSDSGIGDSGSSDSGTPCSIIDDPLQKIRKNENTEIEDYSEYIYTVIYESKNIYTLKAEKNLTSRQIKIIEAGKELFDMLTDDTKDNIEDFKKRILAPGGRPPHQLSSEQKQQYLLETFKQLMVKVSETASWRSYGHILICLDLIKTVATDLEVEQNPQFKTDLEAAYKQYVVSHFSKFITEMGGFSDIADYTEHVKYYNGNGGGFNWMATAAVGAAAGMVWLARKIF